MIWEPKWPFKSREHASAHAAAYLAGSYTPSGARPISLVDACDLEIERWLEDRGAALLRKEPGNIDAIRKIWLWKMRATITSEGGCADAPASILSRQFAESLSAALGARDESQMSEAVNSLAAFDGVKVIAASAFIYWLRPDEYQVIDRRVTAALNLPFGNTDYTTDNHLQYCKFSRNLRDQEGLSLRQIDRALFTFQKLLKWHPPTTITI